MTPTVAYLASGKLYLKRDGSAAELIESAYGQELIDDAIRQRQKNEWKTRSETGRLMAGSAAWAEQLTGGETRRVHISAVTTGSRPGELLYALDMDQVGGLFRYDVADRHEQRLYHGHVFRARHVSRHPEEKSLIAFSTPQEDGTSAIAVMNLENNELHPVTEGDSLDEAPSWAPGGGRKLVFQSAGLGRNQQGALAGIGPYAVQQLDLDREDLTTLVEGDKHDYLLPRLAADGSLYYLRRPYQGLPRASGWAILRDIVLLPVRLVLALLAFLNFFSLMFSGKPLMTAGGPKKEGPTPQHMMLWGKMIDAEKAELKARKGEPVALVPDDWQLIRRTVDGAETVLQSGVVSYDLAEDGSVVYSNGSAVYLRSPDGRTSQICTGKLVEHVAVVG